MRLHLLSPIVSLTFVFLTDIADCEAGAGGLLRRKRNNNDSRNDTTKELDIAEEFSNLWLALVQETSMPPTKSPVAGGKWYLAGCMLLSIIQNKN